MRGVGTYPYIDKSAYRKGPNPLKSVLGRGGGALFPPSELPIRALKFSMFFYIKYRLKHSII